MSDAYTRAVIIEFDEKTTDTEAALVRNGLRMFKGIRRIIPVRGALSDAQARQFLARDQVGEENAELRQRCAELALRLQNAQEAVTGPVPKFDDSEPISAVFDGTDLAIRRAAR